MPEFDAETWKRDQIRAQAPEGGDDPADEVARTDAQGFGAAVPAEGSATDQGGDGEAAGGTADAAGATGTERRGPGRPRKERPEGPGAPTKSVRVQLELGVYAQVKMTSWSEERSPGNIIADLVREHYARIGDRTDGGDGTK